MRISRHSFVLAVSIFLLLGAGPLPAQIYINELLFAPPSGGGDDEYLELRGEPGVVVGPSTHLIWIEGDADAPGVVRGSGLLTGQVFGGNGFIILPRLNHPYALDPDATEVNLIGPEFPDTSMTFMLVQAPVTPSVGDDIDTDDDGVPDGTIWDGWTVLDAVATTGTDAQEFAYADLIFAQAPASIQGAPGARVVDASSLTEVRWLGRNGDSRGATAGDWVAANVEGTAPNWILTLGQALPSDWGGLPLDHVGGPNPLLAVFVDGFESGDTAAWSVTVGG